MKKTKKQKYSMSEFQRLLCSWTMELASYFEDECDMDQKTALEKAHLNRSLQMYLGDGVVTLSMASQESSTNMCMSEAVTLTNTNGPARILPIGIWTRSNSARSRRRDY